ncbi:hypothetical protein G6F43_010887 [Rhizopus delemar]|nr:hypothetical protein G6F43_010887 [Rhizopus delemar]
MSNLKTYKANFKTSNKYLKYFCDNAASEWTVQKYQTHFRKKGPEELKKVFMKNLKIVKNNAKGIPSDVNQYINQVMGPDSDPCTSSSHNINNITIKGNYYHAERDVVINEIAERDVKKQKTNHDDKEKIEEVDFKQKWVEFLADAERNKNFHRYSPEKNGVTRLGAKLSPHPNANKDVYRHLKKQLKPCEASSIWMEAKNYIDDIIAATNIDDFEENIETKAFAEDNKKICQYIKDICKIMVKVYKKTPSISRTEAVFNINMIFPCFEAMLAMMKKNEHGPYFIPGEDELAAMTAQLKKMESKPDKRKIYKADGIIRLAELGDLEVLVLETAGAFGHDDHAKESFDNSKGMFALLAMLETVAEHYKFAPIEEFRKLKLYFVQPSNKYIRLWSMQYAKHGLYNFVREKKILVGEDFEEREEHLASLVNFFMTLKSCLEETMKTIAVLKNQHKEKEKCGDSENSQEVLLTDIMELALASASLLTDSADVENQRDILLGYQNMGGRIIAMALNTILTCTPLPHGFGQLLVAVVFNKAFVIGRIGRVGP